MTAVEISSWRDLAACLSVDTDLFFPHATDDAGIARAKAVCEGCPVREPCLEEALARREDYGVRGGKSEVERRSLRRRRRRAAQQGAS